MRIPTRITVLLGHKAGLRRHFFLSRKLFNDDLISKIRAAAEKEATKAAEKAQEKAKEMGKDAARKAKEMGKDAVGKAKEMGKDAAGKAKESVDKQAKEWKDTSDKGFNPENVIRTGGKKSKDLLDLATKTAGATMPGVKPAADFANKKIQDQVDNATERAVKEADKKFKK